MRLSPVALVAALALVTTAVLAIRETCREERAAATSTPCDRVDGDAESRAPRRRWRASAVASPTEPPADVSGEDLPAPRPDWRPAALEWAGPTSDPLEPDVAGTIVGPDGAPVAFALLRGPLARCRGGFGEYEGWGRARAGRFAYALRRDRREVGTWLFSVRAPGFVPECVSITPAQQEVLRAGDRLDDLRVVLRPAATVTGRVHLADGRPAAGARIGVARRAFDLDPAPDMFRRTEPDGSYRLDEVDAAAAGWIVAEWYDRESQTYWCAPAAPLADRAKPGARTELDLVLDPQSVVALTIEFRGWREGLEIAEDAELSWFDCPGTREASVLSGRHRFHLRSAADRQWRQEIEFVIPHGVTSHRIFVDVARE